MADPAVPRYVVTLQPDPDRPGEVLLFPVANAGDVTLFEIGRALAKGSARCLDNPNQRIPTGEEILESQRAATLVQTHPAVKILVNLPDEHQLFIGAEALAQLGGSLKERGWVSVGAAPAGRACEHALDPAAFVARYLPKIVGPDPELTDRA